MSPTNDSQVSDNQPTDEPPSDQPPSDQPGVNQPTGNQPDPDRMMGLDINRKMSSLNNDELNSVAGAIKVQEGWRAGNVYS